MIFRVEPPTPQSPQPSSNESPPSQHSFKLVRPLNFCIENQWQRGDVTIGPIEKTPDGRWRCHCTIAFIHPDDCWLYGEDPIHALDVCLHFVGKLIRRSEIEGIRIYQTREFDHGGFDKDCYEDGPLPAPATLVPLESPASTHLHH
jgi:hypothetical protein